MRRAVVRNPPSGAAMRPANATQFDDRRRWAMRRRRLKSQASLRQMGAVPKQGVGARQLPTALADRGPAIRRAAQPAQAGRCDRGDIRALSSSTARGCRSFGHRSLATQPMLITHRSQGPQVKLVGVSQSRRRGVEDAATARHLTAARR